jgi:hypothetical protein
MNLSFVVIWENMNETVCLMGTVCGPQHGLFGLEAHTIV